MFLLLLFLISLGPFRLPNPSFTLHFIKVLFAPFFQLINKNRAQSQSLPPAHGSSRTAVVTARFVSSLWLLSGLTERQAEPVSHATMSGEALPVPQQLPASGSNPGPGTSDTGPSLAHLPALPGSRHAHSILCTDPASLSPASSPGASAVEI